MRVAYLVNQYPKVSHTFIRREIGALERDPSVAGDRDVDCLRGGLLRHLGLLGEVGQPGAVLADAGGDPRLGERDVVDARSPHGRHHAVLDVARRDEHEQADEGLGGLERRGGLGGSSCHGTP